MSAPVTTILAVLALAGCRNAGKPTDTGTITGDDTGPTEADDTGLDGGDDDGGGDDAGGDDAGGDDTGPVDVDQDGDGYPESEDCNDLTDAINPGVEEIPGDGIDQDCDGSDVENGLPLADIEHTWLGTYWSMAGMAIAGGGDIDGDGVADIVAGAPWETKVDLYGCPIAFYTMAADSSGELDEVATTVITGLDGCFPGGWVKPGMGDLNGDGYDDVAIGIPDGGTGDYGNAGHVAIYLGPLSGTLGSDDADTHIYSPWSLAQLGYSTAIHGGTSTTPARLLAGAPYVTDEGPGELYIWEDVPAGTILSDTAEVTIVGIERSGAAGFTTDRSADFTGDGLADLVVSEPFRSAHSPSAGSVFILEGSLLQDTVSMDEGVELAATTASSEAGRAMDTVTDANGDGHADLLVGGPLNAEPDVRGGTVWLVYGPITASGELDDVAGATVVAERAYEWLGINLSDAGDIDGDGRSELAMSAPRDYYYGEDLPGKVYIFRGGLEGAHTGADADLVIQGEHFGDYAGGGLDGGFDATGDGMPDLVIGAPRFDVEDGRDGGKIYLLTDLAEAL